MKLSKHQLIKNLRLDTFKRQQRNEFIIGFSYEIRYLVFYGLHDMLLSEGKNLKKEKSLCTNWEKWLY